MEKVVICSICGVKPGRFTCSMCGRVVCEDCYDASTGLCVACRRGKRIEEDLKE